MNADGSNPVQLTGGPDSDRRPAWSPDGTKIAFQRKVAGSEFNIYVVNVDGTGPTQLTRTPNDDNSPSWSPDGTKIAFSNSLDIWVMDPDGINLVDLTPGTSSRRTRTGRPTGPGSPTTNSWARSTPTSS